MANSSTPTDRLTAREQDLTVTPPPTATQDFQGGSPGKIT